MAEGAGWHPRRGSATCSRMAERLSLFATAARGTEPLLAEELGELDAKRIRQDRGGVRFLASLEEALRICLWSRIAMRVLYPLASLEAEGAEGLYEAARQVAWEEHLTATSTLAVEATLRGSEHRHSGFVALKIKDAVVDRLRQRLGSRPDVDTRDPLVRIVAHLAGTRLTLSLDLCGAPLYRRGYRTDPTLAPLKETLAAAILRAASYRGEEALLDPLCGSATFLIEGALIAANRAPGGGRRMAVERWPHLGQEAAAILTELRAEAQRGQRPPAAPIAGFDKSERAVTAARKNIRAAGVADWVRVTSGDATAPFEPPASAGLLLTNPPYGERQGLGQQGMKTFYFRLGENLRRLNGWRIFVLSGNPAFESAFHTRPTSRRRLWNGPIECQLLGYSPGPPPSPSRPPAGRRRR